MTYCMISSIVVVMMVINDDDVKGNDNDDDHHDDHTRSSHKDQILCATTLNRHATDPRWFIQTCNGKPLNMSQCAFLVSFLVSSPTHYVSSLVILFQKKIAKDFHLIDGNFQ